MYRHEPTAIMYTVQRESCSTWQLSSTEEILGKSAKRAAELDGVGQINDSVNG